MQREKIYIQRLNRFIEEVYKKKFVGEEKLIAEFIYDKKTPIPYKKAIKAKFKPIKQGEKWGEDWGCGWFKFTGKIPKKFSGKEVGAIIDVCGEGCVFINDSPWVGITNKIHWYNSSGKDFIPLFDKAKSGEKIELLIETGANGLFGKEDKDYILKTAKLVCVDRKIWELDAQLHVLLSLIETLDEKSPRRKKLLFGVNEIMNIWDGGKNIEACIAEASNLINQPANNSSMTAYSIGHAHLDLAWLWPVRETRRKGGRTFATALKYMEEYPEYLFGASQPQLYQWVKEDYPELFKRVKKAVKDGKWEVQGAMWVEPDMNIPSGESLVRQVLYGKQFYKEEFGINVDNLWLPDVFGYSAALPQILTKSGVKYFMTQKISWNETNTFPHHTFMWEGIDGTKILSHFLPTNNYNLSNTPKELIESEQRFAQADISDEFLNLYGIGDGGGGPSRNHIENGIMQQSCEGSPKFKFSFADDFFKKIDKIPKEKLPVWVGELYLELHRGTYTTQALMKKNNRRLEGKLHDVEFLSVLGDKLPKKKIDKIWQDTLLNQFHDILPGSSINWVYKDAGKLSKQNLEKLNKIQKSLFEQIQTKGKHPVIWNSQPWERTEVITLPAGKEAEVKVPSMGYTSEISIPKKSKKLIATESVLENEFIKIQIAEDGTFSSIFDKEEKREVLEGSANKLLLWEDKPNNWGAWDVNHFYRETTPEQAKRKSVEVLSSSALQVVLKQKFTVGKSKITQKITLTKHNKFIKIENKVDWKEEHKMLRVSAEVAVHSADASYEIQYGTIKRPTHSNTSWDAAKFEVAAQRFADISQPDYGFAVINDCKYGHYIQGNTVDLNLLRSPADVDKTADIHKHEFTYGYLPHFGNLINSDVLKAAHNLNSPLIVNEVEKLPKLKSESYFDVIGKNVKLETVKKAEDGKGIIVRFYEYSGTNTEVFFQTPLDYKNLIETNLIEEDFGKPVKFDGKSKLKFKPFEIRSFRLYH
jgi:alpha-mannosidase